MELRQPKNARADVRSTVDQREVGLEACARESFAGRSARLICREQLKPHVHRLRVEVDGEERALIAKWSDPVVAHRCQLVSRRWLAAVDLEDCGPTLRAIAAAPSGEGAWHVYDDLGGQPISTDQPVDDEVQAAVETVARVHTALAEHPLLPEFRLWGGDRGAHFYSANVRDALGTLGAMDLDWGEDGMAVRDALVERLGALRDQAYERARLLAVAGGPETLLHGDLWPTNAVVVPHAEGPRVRLIDWDEAAAGPIGFDLATFLGRFDSSQRLWILDAYRQAVDRLAGWSLPGEVELNQIFETVAYARLASLLVWSASGCNGNSDWLIERLGEIVEWFDAVHPVLPPR
jgi:Phosphotransferase enzyme family